RETAKENVRFWLVHGVRSEPMQLPIGRTQKQAPPAFQYACRFCGSDGVKTLVLLFCLFPVLAFAAPPAPLLLTHVTVIDGSGAPPQQDMTIAVNGDRIADVYRSGSKPEPDIAHYKDHLRALMLGGVTGLRDMAGDDRLLAYLALQTGSDEFQSPDIFYVALMAGPSFFAEDPRAQDASKGEPLGFAPWMQAITAATDLPLAVAEAKGTGATALKLYANLPASLIAPIT